MAKYKKKKIIFYTVFAILFIYWVGNQFNLLPTKTYRLSDLVSLKQTTSIKLYGPEINETVIQEPVLVDTLVNQFSDIKLKALSSPRYEARPNEVDIINFDGGSYSSIVLISIVGKDTIKIARPKINKTYRIVGGLDHDLLEQLYNEYR